VGDKLFRGSSDLKLTPEGREYMRELNAQILKKGGCPWKVYSSTQARAVESAHLIAQGCLNTQFARPCEAWNSWFLGSYEGQPVDKYLNDIKDLVANRPWVVPPGMGPASTAPGTSFNSFKSRVLDETRKLMTELDEHSSKRIFVVTHFHVVRLIEAWLAKYGGEPGPQDDLYNAKVYNEDRGYPGEVFYLRKRDGKWFFSLVDCEKLPAFLPGGYLFRHGATSSN
jgi:broad specificity phosphatase PhoE